VYEQILPNKDMGTEKRLEPLLDRFNGFSVHVLSDRAETG